MSVHARSVCVSMCRWMKEENARRAFFTYIFSTLCDERAKESHGMHIQNKGKIFPFKYERSFVTNEGIY